MARMVAFSDASSGLQKGGLKFAELCTTPSAGVINLDSCESASPTAAPDILRAEKLPQRIQIDGTRPEIARPVHLAFYI